MKMVNTANDNNNRPTLDRKKRIRDMQITNLTIPGQNKAADQTGDS